MTHFYFEDETYDDRLSRITFKEVNIEENRYMMPKMRIQVQEWPSVRAAESRFHEWGSVATFSSIVVGFACFLAGVNHYFTEMVAVGIVGALFSLACLHLHYSRKPTTYLVGNAWGLDRLLVIPGEPTLATKKIVLDAALERQQWEALGLLDKEGGSGPPAERRAELVEAYVQECLTAPVRALRAQSEQNAQWIQNRLEGRVEVNDIDELTIGESV